MRSSGIFLLVLCFIGSCNAMQQLPPKVAELLQPFLDRGGSKSTLLKSLVGDPKSYRYDEERAIHLLLDGIVREVEANLGLVDASFEKQKQAVRDIRSARYADLERATAAAVAEMKKLETALSDAERNKIEADNAYDGALGQSAQQKLEVMKLKKAEKEGKIKATKLFKQRYLEIDAEHNESRKQYVDELMFIAKLRQMIEQLNADYKHKQGGQLSSSPTISPTPAPTKPTPSPTRSPTASPTLLKNLDGTSGWRLVAQEAAHHAGLLTDLGKHFGYFNSPSFNLGPTYKYPRDYTEVAVTWADQKNYVRFITTQDFFDSHTNLNIHVWHVEASAHETIFEGGAAKFCRAAAQDGSSRIFPGETSWAVLPTSDNNRKCGCSSGNAGNGFYYGGTANDCTQCTCHGGGFMGYLANGKDKFDAPVGKQLKIWVRKGRWLVLSGCTANEQGTVVTKNSAGTPNRYTATAVSATPVLTVEAAATATNTHSQVGLTLLEQGGINRKSDISPNWGITFGPGGVATLFGLGGTIPSDNLAKFANVVLGDKTLKYNIGDVAKIELKNGLMKAYLNGEYVHTFGTKINLLHEATRAQFSFLEDGASLSKIGLTEMGHWTPFTKKCQGNNNNCALKSQEQCVAECYNEANCRMYMYNKVTGGCCFEQCFPPDYVPASPMPEVDICDAWMEDCSQDGGWDSYVKEYPKA